MKTTLPPRKYTINLILLKSLYFGHGKNCLIGGNHPLSILSGRTWERWEHAIDAFDFTLCSYIYALFPDSKIGTHFAFSQMPQKIIW